MALLAPFQTEIGLFRRIKSGNPEPGLVVKLVSMLPTHGPSSRFLQNHLVRDSKSVRDSISLSRELV